MKPATLSFSVLVVVLVLIQTGCCRLSPDQLRYQLKTYGDGKKFYDYSTILDRLRRESEEADSPLRGSTVYTGICNGGKTTLISIGGGFSGKTLYFDSDTEKFKAITTWSDMATIWCGLQKHWPYKHRGSDWVVTEVIRGDLVRVGDRGER